MSGTCYMLNTYDVQVYHIRNQSTYVYAHHETLRLSDDVDGFATLHSCQEIIVLHALPRIRGILWEFFPFLGYFIYLIIKKQKSMTEICSSYYFLRSNRSTIAKFLT